MRALWLAGGATLLGGGGAYVGGAFDRGQYYPIAPAAVEARLAGLDFGDEAQDAEARLVLRSRGPAVVRWDLMLQGKRVADVRAHLSPEAPGTRVRVEFAFTKGDALMGLEEDPFLNDIAEIAMEEKVDSTLDGRPFDETRLQARLVAAAAANPQAVMNLQKKAEQTLAEQKERAEDADYYGGTDGGMGFGQPGQPTVSARAAAPAKAPRPTDFSETHADGGWGKK